MKKIDYGTLIIFILTLLMLSFFWKCRFDLIILIVTAVVASIIGYATHMQYKNFRELNESNKEK